MFSVNLHKITYFYTTTKEEYTTWDFRYEYKHYVNYVNGYAIIKEDVIISRQYDGLSPSERCPPTYLDCIEYIYGFVDTACNVVVPPRYGNVCHFVEGYAAVQYSGKWGFIDTTGNEIISPRYEELRPFFYEIIPETDFYYPKWNVKRRNINDRQFSFTYSPYKRDGRWGLINTHLREIVPPHYDEIVRNDMFNKGYMLMKLGDKWGIIDSIGAEIMAPLYEDLSYLSFSLFSQGDQFIGMSKKLHYLGMKMGGKWGLLDSSLIERVSPRYDVEPVPMWLSDIEATPFLLIRKDSLYGLLDAVSLKEVLAPQFDEIKNYSSFDSSLKKKKFLKKPERSATFQDSTTNLEKGNRYASFGVFFAF